MFTLRQKPKLHVFNSKFLLPSFIAIAVIAAVTTSWFFWDPKNPDLTNYDRYYDYERYGNLQAQDIDLTFDLYFQKLSFEEFTFQIRYELSPSNTFTDSNSSLTKAINVSMGDNTEEFKANSSYLVLSGMTTSPNLQGRQRDYPFDVWQSYAYFSVVENNSTSSAQPRLGFAVSYEYLSLAGNTTAVVWTDSGFAFGFELQRLRLVKGFRSANSVLLNSILLVMAMWIITALYTFLTLKFVYFKEEHPKDIQEIIGYSSLGAAILFALPTVRGAQPGVPTSACIIDAVTTHLRRAFEMEADAKEETVEEKDDDKLMA
ncbi:hypothetical protein BC938DRAFT_481042 [Jimgerdemannia flammicorona]|uniref:Uncharacterized protein n=1 Tax=Jimgerdemannia flammicorona TaxID=994334 RepID=A0A433QX19_9FUNG|nr:hypothetical protein BC938DRAFT_481042 [Jimgerdemannia flammicorona]